MGCKNSKPEPVPVQLSEEATRGDAQLFGLHVSMNCMGAAILMEETKCGSLVETKPGEGTMTPEYVAINPFHAIPCFKDKDLVVAESNAILRAMSRYKATTYPNAAADDELIARAAFIDWAMDRFASVHAKDVVATIYPVLGFTQAPEDIDAAAEAASNNLEVFADIFLKEKFIGGGKLSIADYKVAPFLFAFSHPVVKEKSRVVVPDRILKYNAAFAMECKESKLLSSAGGSSLKEVLDGGQPDIRMRRTEINIPIKQDNPMLANSSGPIGIFGLTVSMNCAGPLMLSQHVNVGKHVICKPGEAASMNAGPFGGIPALAALKKEGDEKGKDGGFHLAESCAILRFLARTGMNTGAADESLYPMGDAKRQAHIDWAMDRFSFGPLYNDCIKTIYVALGFAEPPADEAELKASGKVAMQNLSEFASAFLKEKFIGGEKPSIADFKVAPFFAAYGHPRLAQMCEIELPEQIKTFNEQFRKAIPAAEKLLYGEGSTLDHLAAKDKEEVLGGEAAAMEAAMENQVHENAELTGGAQDREPEIVEQPQKPSVGCCG